MIQYTIEQSDAHFDSDKERLDAMIEKFRLDNIDCQVTQKLEVDKSVSVQKTTIVYNVSSLKKTKFSEKKKQTITSREEKFPYPYMLDGAEWWAIPRWEGPSDHWYPNKVYAKLQQSTKTQQPEMSGAEATWDMPENPQTLTKAVFDASIWFMDGFSTTFSLRIPNQFDPATHQIFKAYKYRQNLNTLDQVGIQFKRELWIHDTVIPPGVRDNGQMLYARELLQVFKDRCFTQAERLAAPEDMTYVFSEPNKPMPTANNQPGASRLFVACGGMNLSGAYGNGSSMSRVGQCMFEIDFDTYNTNKIIL